MKLKIERLEVDQCERIHVNGNVKRINSTTGDIKVSGSVSGDVETVSGDVDCLDVSGRVSTMSGNIRHA